MKKKVDPSPGVDSTRMAPLETVVSTIAPQSLQSLRDGVPGIGGLLR
ncbi:MAG TPA: hypothetical protein HA263_01670 [Methanoregulaceae archaeon]|nr:hypothetical protein [Methanoregulaceae archaeon]